LNLQAQSCWWEPPTPLMGQPVEIFYDAVAGTLPDDADEVRMHWGIYDPANGSWSTPPEEMWPPGTELHGSGPAVQSPMAPEGEGIFSLLVEPTPEIEWIAFVFTDGDNWDNNDEQDWHLEFISDEIVSWWTPEEPETGQPLTIFYNPVPGELPNEPTQVLLHWGVNEFGHGNWFTPPEEMWPPGTVDWGDGHAVQSPMEEVDGIYQITITPIDTIHHIHFVITDGTIWDTNDGLNWNIAIGEAPDYREVLQRFCFDPRSIHYAGLGTQITAVYLASEFNGWSMTGYPLEGPDANGCWWRDWVLLEGVYDYKFVVNGSEWTWDPDNPMINESDNNNSQVVVTASQLPILRDPSHHPGTVFDAPQTLDFSITLTANDYDHPLTEIEVELDAVSIPYDYDAEEELLTCAVELTAFDRYQLTIAVEDSAAHSTTSYFPFAVHDPDDGLLLLDAVNDEQYDYPAPPGDYADLEALTLTAAAGGDSINFTAELALRNDYSRLCLQISPSLQALAAGQPVSLELDSRDWVGNGVFATLCDPAAPQYEPDFHNRLYISRDPLEELVPIEVTCNGDSYQFSLAVDDLESVMGSYSWEWYFSLYSYLSGVAPVQGHAFEVGENQGGIEYPWDPDVYDLLCADSEFLQRRLLTNWFEGRTATLDADGRGFRAVLPEEIGEGVASPGPRLRILTQGAPTIVPEQEIVGTVSASALNPVIIYINADSVLTDAVNDTFQVEITLQDGLNVIQAKAYDGEGYPGYSAQISYNLFIEHAPVPLAAASVLDEVIHLSGAGTTDVDEDITAWLWEAEPGNPEPVEIQSADQQEATLASIPATNGEYYFKLTVTDGQQNSGWARTFFTVDDGEVIPTAVTMAPAWIGDAIVYEIYPRSFSASGDLPGITANLQYIADLGVNTVWLMPIFEGPSHHGYEITDYYAIEADYGSMEDFDALVTAVHDLDMRIILDMVINHTGIGHPWMQDCFQFGEYSHYWDYYDRDANGDYTYYYDWVSLPNINVSNPETNWTLAEMALFWLDDHNVDGFRYDVAWGPQSRNFWFWVEYREYLKRQFPDILMLAEANGNDFTYYNDRFDSAYDWSLHHEGNGGFINLYNGVPDVEGLNTLITNWGVWYPDYAWPFRFMENHDESRYLANHSVAQTKQVAAILLTIPGLPMIYAGQEVGELTPRNQINWSDPQNLSPWYERLLAARNEYSSLRSMNFGRLNNDDMAHTYSYYRRNTASTVLAFHNLENSTKTVEFQIPCINWGYDPDSTYYLNDLYNQQWWEIQGSDLAALPLEFGTWQSRVCVIADTILVEAVQPPAVAGTFQLHPAYPNPFNPSTTISFELPRTAPVELTIYNLLGQQVARPVDQVLTAGAHQLVWRADGYAAGLYFYRLTAGEYTSTRKMMLVK